jgi:hypothetical protein
LHFAGYQGVPPPEKNALFTLTVNLVGYMQPVIDYSNRRINTDSELSTVKLQDLGISSGKAKLVLSHQYIKPVLTEEQAKAAIVNLHKQLSSRGFTVPNADVDHQDDVDGDCGDGGNVSGLQTQTRQTASSVSVNSSTGILNGSPSANEQTKPVEIQIPEDRNRSVCILSSRNTSASASAFTSSTSSATTSSQTGPGVSGMVDKDEDLPDEFYELTEEEGLAVLQSIRRRASNTPYVAPIKPAVIYSSTKIRIRWPQHSVTLEGLFRPEETVGDLRRFVTKSLKNNCRYSPLTFQLSIGPPYRVLDDESTTLKQLSLVPNGLVTCTPFKFDQTSTIINNNGKNNNDDKCSNSNYDGSMDKSNQEDIVDESGFLLPHVWLHPDLLKA